MDNLITNPNDSWAQVELFRLQYGCLPEPGDMREIDIPLALMNLADIIDSEDIDNLPPRFSVTSVIRYASKLLGEKE